MRVLLVEGDANMATTIATHLKLEGVDCDLANNNSAAVNLVISNTYQLILVDSDIPCIEDFYNFLEHRGIAIPVFSMTSRATNSSRECKPKLAEGICFLKPFSMEKLIINIKACVDVPAGLPNTFLLSDLEVNLLSKSAYRDGEKLSLSPTGWKILLELIRCYPKVAKRSDLEKSIWGYKDHSGDLLNVHMYRLRKKIDKPYIKPLIHTAPNFGFILKELDFQ
ncbi:MAG: response regulator transcription factor [Cellvibrionaceae bacterium]|nr:response regulator transcription factor [Cellvibrionaceae bacterium]